MVRVLCTLLPGLVATSAIAQPISGGTATDGDPAVVALVNEASQVMCTATIIAAHTAITAAHCVDGRDVARMRVFVGSSVASGGTFIAVADARIHPGFDPGGRDIAMLTLREPSPVAPVALEDAPLDAGSLVGTSVRIVGFGLTMQGATDSGDKREGTAEVAAVRTEEIIVVPGPALSCLGDSGGPLLLPSGTIGGVVSRSDALCRDHAVYTRIDTARDALVDPYLAETAPGSAALGEPCFFDGHCAEGSCAPLDDDPATFVCAADGGGCGCTTATTTTSPSTSTLALVVVVGLWLARRRQRNTVPRA